MREPRRSGPWQTPILQCAVYGTLSPIQLCPHLLGCLVEVIITYFIEFL